MGLLTDVSSSTSFQFSTLLPSTRSKPLLDAFETVIAVIPSTQGSMAQARLREALNAGSGTQKEKGPPVADGILSVTPDTQEALEWRSKRSIIDNAGASSSYTEDESGRDSCRKLHLWCRWGSIVQLSNANSDTIHYLV